MTFLSEGRYKLLAVVWLLLASLSAMDWLFAEAVMIEEVKDSDESRYGGRIDEDDWVDSVVFSPNADQVELLVYDDPAQTTPKHVVPMTKHGSDWKVRVRGPGVGHGLMYMYRADGAT